MRKTVLTILAASLIVGSTFQVASAAQRHTRHLYRTPAIQQFQQYRNTNDFMGGPSLYNEQQYWNNEGAGHAISAPAGRG